jgi:hypothetical protein
VDEALNLMVGSACRIHDVIGEEPVRLANATPGMADKLLSA